MSTNWNSYQDRFARVIQPLHDHLDEALDLNRLAEIACLSPYHWHRIFHAVQGETAAATVRRLRLQRAAAMLNGSDLPISEVAQRSGYPYVQSFNRSFRTTYRKSPAQYRLQGGVATAASQKGSSLMFPVEIRSFPALKLAVLDHQGPYLKIGKAFETLGAHLGAQGKIGRGTRMIAFYYDDPTVVAENELRASAGYTLADTSDLASPYRAMEIQPGDCAVLTFKGPYSDLHVPWRWIYSEWLVKSDRQPAEAPPFEEYLNDPRQTAPQDLLTNICIPLKSA
jgi:AraC family transcriptional regulator